MVYLHRLQVEFIYEGYWVKVKITGAKKVENSYSCNVKLRLAIPPILSNIELRCLPVAWDFRVQWIKWCNRHLCHVTRSDHGNRDHIDYVISRYRLRIRRACDNRGVQISVVNRSSNFRTSIYKFEFEFGCTAFAIRFLTRNQRCTSDKPHCPCLAAN